MPWKHNGPQELGISSRAGAGSRIGVRHAQCNSAAWAQLGHSRFKEISNMTPRSAAQATYMRPTTSWQRPTSLVRMHVHLDPRDPDVVLVTRDPEGPHAIPVIPTSKAHCFYCVLGEWGDDVAHDKPVDADPVISEITFGATANHPAAAWRAQHGQVRQP
jgi:hypothetical protein